MKRVNKKDILVIGIILLLIFLIMGGGFTGNSIKSFFGLKKETTNTNAQSIAVTKDNLAWFLTNINLVRELPKDAEIEFTLYNFNTGVRQWEESYVIKKAQVYPGKAEDPDVVVLLSSKYVTSLGNFCNTIINAKNNGDFSFEIKKSKASLLWKYKGMMEYKSCFGF